MAAPASSLATKAIHAAPPLPVANVGMLPSDMLYNILLRLPANTLCRLRLFCRSWRSITSDPLFAKEHWSRHRYMVALRHSPSERHVLDLNGHSIKRIRIADQDVRYMKTELDLVAASSCWEPAYVFNLATDATTVLDVGIMTSSGHDGKRMYLPAYVPGYVSSTKEYKVLCVIQCSLGKGCGIVQPCYVSKLADTGWRAAPQPPVKVSYNPWHMAAGGEMAYFLVSQFPPRIEADNIALFDFATDEWRPTTIHGPLTSLLSSSNGQELNCSSPPYRFVLSWLCGCLVMVHRNHQGCSTDIWFLADIKNARWTKQSSIRWTHQLQIYGQIYPIQFLQDGRIVVWVVDERLLGTYNPKTSTWTDIVAFKNFFAGSVYHGSLLCPGIF